LKLTTDRHEASRGLFATAELLVNDAETDRLLVIERVYEQLRRHAGRFACVGVCRRFGAKCGGCEQEIGPNELVRRARSRVYHLKCFTCVLCHKQLSTGEELYMLDENRFICKDDYLAKFQGNDALSWRLHFIHSRTTMRDDQPTSQTGSGLKHKLFHNLQLFYHCE